MLGNSSITQLQAQTTTTTSQPPSAGRVVGGSNIGHHEEEEEEKRGVDGISLEGGGERSFGGNRWPREETLALLKIRSDMDVAFREASFKGPLWNEVSRKLAELGYNRSAKKCKEKFENVYKYHKRTREGRTGKSEGKTYRFFDQLFDSQSSLVSLPLPTPPPQQVPIPATMPPSGIGASNNVTVSSIAPPTAADLLPVQELEWRSPEVIDPDETETLPSKLSDFNHSFDLNPLPPSEYEPPISMTSELSLRVPGVPDINWPVHDPFASASAVPPEDKICCDTSHQPHQRVESKCSKINRMPELSLVCLNSIDLSFARHLTRLKYLILKACLNLRGIPSLVKLKSLLWLDLSDCINVKELSELPKNMKFLYLGGTAIEELPPSIICLSTLLVLDLEHCTRLKKLPSGICELKSLEIFNLSGCFSLPHQPPELLLEEMVRGFVKQECVRELRQISGFFSPWDISQVLAKVWITRKVEEVILHMAKLTKIHLDADALTRIFHISLLKTYVIFRVAASKQLPLTFQTENLVEIRLPYNNLQQLWTGSLGLVNVRLIDLRHSNLMTLPDFSEAQKLVSLNLRGCVNLLNVSSICSLPKLEHLDLRGCKSLTVLPSVADLKLLKTFRLSGCSNLKSLPPSLGLLHSLNVLDLNRCSGLKELPKSISDLTSLESLNMSGCYFLLNRLERSKTKALPSSDRTHLSGSTYKSGRTATIYTAFQSTEEDAKYKQRICTSKKAKKEFAAKAVEIQDNVGKARDEDDNGKEATKLGDRKRKRETLEIEGSACEDQKGERGYCDLNEVIDLKSQSSLETEPSEKYAKRTSGDGMFFDTTKSSPKSPSQLASTPVLPALHGSQLTSLPDEDFDALDDPGPAVECATEVGISSEEKATSEFEKENNMVTQQRSNNADRLEDLKGIPGIHNLNSKDRESLDSCLENDKNIEDDGEVNALKDEIDRLQEQLAALEKRRDVIYQCRDSLDSELKPLHAEQHLRDVNLNEELKLKEDDLEALRGWEDVKKMVAELVLDLKTIF